MYYTQWIISPHIVVKMVEVRIKQDNKERVIKISDVTVRDQETFIEKAKEIEKNDDPLELMKFVRQTVLKFVDITEDEYLDLITTESNKLQSAVMKELKPFSGESGKDF